MSAFTAHWRAAVIAGVIVIAAMAGFAFGRKGAASAPVRSAAAAPKPASEQLAAAAPMREQPAPIIEPRAAEEREEFPPPFDEDCARAVEKITPEMIHAAQLAACGMHLAAEEGSKFPMPKYANETQAEWTRRAQNRFGNLAQREVDCWLRTIAAGYPSLALSRICRPVTLLVVRELHPGNREYLMHLVYNCMSPLYEPPKTVDPKVPACARDLPWWWYSDLAYGPNVFETLYNLSGDAEFRAEVLADFNNRTMRNYGQEEEAHLQHVLEGAPSHAPQMRTLRIWPAEEQTPIDWQRGKHIKR